MFFLVFMDIAWSDLLCEAVYSTHLREKPEHGPNLISYIWGGGTSRGLEAFETSRGLQV